MLSFQPGEGREPAHDDDQRPTRVDDTHITEQNRAVEALTKALETDGVAEKDYQIREALQLLAVESE